MGLGYNYRDVEDALKHYRFLKGDSRTFVNEFILLLNDPYQTFAHKRYVEAKTIEQIAEEMGYAPRTLYNFRRKVLKLWRIFNSY